MQSKSPSLSPTYGMQKEGPKTGFAVFVEILNFDTVGFRSWNFVIDKGPLRFNGPYGEFLFLTFEK